MATTFTARKNATSGRRPSKTNTDVVYKFGRAVSFNGTTARASCGDVSGGKNVKTIQFDIRFPNTVTASLERIIDTGNGVLVGSSAGFSETMTGTWRIFINGLDRDDSEQGGFYTVHLTSLTGVDASAVFLAEAAGNFGEIDMCNMQFWSATFNEQDIANTSSKPEKLASSFNNGSVVLADLLAFYPMIEGSGTDIFDYSGNGKDGTLVNQSWLTGLSGCAQTCFMGLKTVAGVLFREDPTDASQDINGVTLDLSVEDGAFNCLGDGQWNHGDVGAIKSAVMVVTPDTNGQDVIDFDDGTHILGISNGIATDWVIVAEDGSNVTASNNIVNETGGTTVVSDLIVSESGTLVGTGWIDETIRVNGAVGTSVIAGVKSVVSIKSSTAFNADNVKLFSTYAGKHHRLLTYRHELSIGEDIQNYNALK